MPIIKQTVVDQITVNENGVLLYREATRIIEDGVQLTQTFHRTSLIPGQDLTGQPASVIAIANAAWTTEVVAAYQAALAEQLEAQRLATLGQNETNTNV